MTGPDDYLRRADVEALLDGKIEALDADVERHDATLNGTGRRITEAARRSALSAQQTARKQADALRTARRQLDLCQQFRYRRFRHFDEAGTPYSALVDLAADRTPLEPVAGTGA